MAGHRCQAGMRAAGSRTRCWPRRWGCWRKTGCQLLRPECAHGINARCPQRWNVAGRKGHDREDERGGAKRGGARLIHAVGHDAVDPEARKNHGQDRKAPTMKSGSGEARPPGRPDSPDPGMRLEQRAIKARDRRTQAGREQLRRQSRSNDKLVFRPASTREGQMELASRRLVQPVWRTSSHGPIGPRTGPIVLQCRSDAGRGGPNSQADRVLQRGWRSASAPRRQRAGVDPAASP